MNDNPNLELEIDLDERPAVGAADRFNRAMKRSEEMVVDVSRRIGNSLDGVTNSLVKVTEFAGALTVVVYGAKELIGAIGGATVAMARHAGAFDSIINTYRAARLALSPTLFTGITVAAGVAAEAVLRLAHARRNLYEQESIQAARTGNTFTGAATIGALGRITGKDVSAFSGMSPGQIRGYAVEFGGIVDPVMRGQRAHEVFGANAEQALGLFKTDIRGAVETANELATAIDYKTRMALGRLTNDLAEPSRALRVIRDEFASLAEQAKTGITVHVAVLYDKAVTRMGQSSTPRTPEEALADSLAAAAAPNVPYYGAIQRDWRRHGGGNISIPGFTHPAAGRVAEIRSRRDSSLEGISAELSRSQGSLAQLLEGNEPIQFDAMLNLSRTIAALKARKLGLENAAAAVKAIDAVLDEFRKLVPVYNDVTGRVEMKTAYRQKLEAAASTLNGQLFSGARDLYIKANGGTVLEREASDALVRQSVINSIFGYMDVGGMRIPLKRSAALNDSAGYNELDLRARLQSVQRFEDEQQIGALGRQTRLDNELGGLQAGPRGQVAAIDQSYQRRITYAQQVYDIEKGYIGELAAGAKMQQDFDEARIDRISRIAQEERKRFDELKHSIEGLIDAGISGGRNMMQALGGMLRSLLLAPLKEFVSTWAASGMSSHRLGIAPEGGRADWFLGKLWPKVTEPQMPVGPPAPVEISRFTGTPIYEKSGSNWASGLFGTYFPDQRVIEVYGDNIRKSGGSDRDRRNTILHEDVHALLEGTNVNKLNALLPNDLVSAAVKSLVKEGYDKDAAQLEVIPRLVAREDFGESYSPSYKKAEGALLQLVGGLRNQRNHRLAATLQAMREESGVDVSASPLRDFRAGGGAGGGMSSYPAMAGGLPLSYDPMAMMSSMGAPGGTSGFAGPVGMLGGMGKAGGLSGAYAGALPFLFNSGSISLGGGAATTAAGIGGLGGTLAGLATSPAALMGGAMLGIQGVRRGGLLGGAMSVGGGALAGAAFGSLVMPGLGSLAGAAIGAGIGLGASLIRSFGFESDVDHARKLVRQVYGIDIGEKSVLQRIVEMAKQQYGGSISTAIYSPQVRELIELYSQTRGGSYFNAYTPRAASLVGAGGVLSQAPLYVNGSSYSFSGSVPGSGRVIGSGSPQVAEVRLSLDAGQTKSVLNGRATSLLVPGMIRG